MTVVVMFATVLMGVAQSRIEGKLMTSARRALPQIDVSGMEGANLGLIGPDRRYDRVETTPLKWLHRDDGLFQIQMRTRAWKSGQRYTAAGTLVIKPDGTCVWQ